MRDLADILDDDHLDLPIRGKTYRVEQLGYRDGLRIRLATEAVQAGDTAKALELMPNDEYEQVMLGDALAQMRADNLPHGWIIRAVMTAQAWSTAGREVAEAMWESGPSPEALAASMQAARDDSTTSPNTPRRARSSSTKQPASTRHTPTSPRKPVKPRSVGRKPSTSGS